ncbi:MAG TPA: sigma-54 dependent transcriptional regulator [Vicinamibacterales bacterium]|nr:sigma-54 dependent transcriptional regulator [Vicinamibacterales bacterium]
MGHQTRERILVVEDDAAARVGLEQLIRGWGFDVEAAADGEQALERIASFHPGIILTDLVVPKIGGLDLLHRVAELGEHVTTVILTAQGTIETAVEAIKQGAYDYLTKPVDLPRLQILLGKIIERHETLREVRVLRRQLSEYGMFGRLVGNSAEMRKIYHVIEQAAPTNASVLISGESGTGKELVAQTIHQLSARASATYVPINCVAIPDMLLESELFGHEKGAFTGAVERRPGCFEIADHGTLFLDEIAEMTPPTQVKLLRVLQERTFRRLGGRMEQAVDVRIIAATNVDPQNAVKEGKLREDLYYRLNVFEVNLPPLRDRKGDLPLLIEHFVNEYNARHGRSVAALEPRAMDLLCAYPWPGNVRELRNVIERATIVANGHFITIDDLPRLSDISRTAPLSAAARGLAPGLTVAEAEQQLIEVTLLHTHGNKTRAAELLGISLKTLHNKLSRAKDDENAVTT